MKAHSVLSIVILLNAFHLGCAVRYTPPENLPSTSAPAAKSDSISTSPSPSGSLKPSPNPSPSPTPTASGPAAIQSRANSGMCIDLRGSSGLNGTAIQIYQCNGTTAQKWTFEANGTLQAMGGCFSDTNYNQTNGTELVLWTCATGADQQWVRNGTQLQLTGTNKCAMISGGNIANSTPIVIWDCNGSAAQQWNFGVTIASAPSPTPPAPPPTPTSITKYMGDSQTAPAGSSLTLYVELKDQYGNLVPRDVTVDWAVTSGGGSLSGPSSTTNTAGRTGITFTLGPSPGTSTVSAKIRGTSASVTFTETATANCNIARPSCQSHRYYGCTADGVYHLSVQGNSYDAYCNMSLDGGGWTAFMVGLNGSPNVFAQFETGTVCPNPGAQCQRMVPGDLSTGDWFAGSCGAKTVKFRLPQEGVNYIQKSIQSKTAFPGLILGTVPISNATAIQGTISGMPTQFWTGNGTDTGWRLQFSMNRENFSGGYNRNTSWNQCDLVPDTTSRIYLYYKRANMALGLVGVGVINANTLLITFSDRVDMATALNLSNYKLSSGIQPISASLSANAKSVTLSTTTFGSGQSYTITINKVMSFELMSVIPTNSYRPFTVP